MLTRGALIDRLAEDLEYPLLTIIETAVNKGQIPDEEKIYKAAKNFVKLSLDGLVDRAAAEVEAGNDFTIPGIVKLIYRYRKPVKKGERWKKGDTVTGFGGIESVKDADSPVVSKQGKLIAAPTGVIAKLKPGTKPEAQKEFFASKAGKALIRRKS